MSNDQVVGLIRFSVLPKSPGAFAISRNKDPDIYRNSLFSAERLEKRFALFEAITLPSLDGQSDKDFNIVICTSTYLPDKYKTRLENLASSRRYLSIRYFGNNKTMRRIAEECVSEAQLSKRVLNFRLDDDDALSFDFINQLRKIGSPCDPDQIISFPSGVYVRKSLSEGLDIAELLYPGIAIGLCHVRDIGSESTIFSSGNHASLDKSGLVKPDASEIWWIRSIYGESDSRQVMDVFERHKKIRTHIGLNSDQVAEMLQKRFPLIDFEMVQQAL